MSYAVPASWASSTASVGRSQGRGDLRGGRRAAQRAWTRVSLARLTFSTRSWSSRGHVQRPALVAEVALELADHGGHGVAHEARAAARLEAVDGLHQAQAGHLDQVLERLVGVAVARGEVAGHGHEAGGERLAGVEVAVAVVANQQLVVARLAGVATWAVSEAGVAAGVARVSGTGASWDIHWMEVRPETGAGLSPSRLGRNRAVGGQLRRYGLSAIMPSSAEIATSVGAEGLAEEMSRSPEVTSGSCGPRIRSRCSPRRPSSARSCCPTGPSCGRARWPSPGPWRCARCGASRRSSSAAGWGWWPSRRPGPAHG